MLTKSLLKEMEESKLTLEFQALVTEKMICPRTIMDARGKS